MNQVELYYDYWLHNVSYALGLWRLAVICTGLWFYSQLSTPLRILLYMVATRLCLMLVLYRLLWSLQQAKHDIWVQLFGKTITQQLSSSNLNIFNIFFYVSIMGFNAWYFFKVSPNKLKRLFKTISLLALLLLAINYIYWESLHSYGSGASLITNVHALVLGIIFLLAHFRYTYANIPPLRNSYLIVGLALFFQSSVLLILEALGQLTHTDNYVLYCKIHILRNLIIFMVETCFILAFWQNKFLVKSGLYHQYWGE